MSPDPEVFALGLMWLVAFLFSTTLHEAAHAWAALRLGDPTAYHGGQVTLDPRPHVAREPVGMLLVPILTYALAGWMMGWASAPYDPMWADRHPRRAAWMALAGPISNLLVVLVSGIAIRLGMLAGVFRAPDTISTEHLEHLVAATSTGGPWTALATFLSILFLLNLLLFVFNLLPLPPLDGASVLPLLIRESTALAYKDFMRQPGIGLLGLFAAWKIFGEIFWPLLLLAIQILYPEAGYA